jgi:hypothetical protein
MFSSTNITAIELRTIWVGNLAHIGNRRNGYRVFTGKPKTKRPLGRLRHISQNEHQSDLKET